MKIKLLALAKTDEKYLQHGIAIYCERLKHYVSFEYLELDTKKLVKNCPPELQKQREAALVLSLLTSSDELYLLDEQGLSLSSVAFAEFIQKKMNTGVKTLVLLIGGAYGFHEDLYARAQGKLSLSKMTFSHQMVRLFTVEQLYRAMTIIKGEPYHHQ